MTSSSVRESPLFVIRHWCFVIDWCLVGLKFQGADVFDIRCLPRAKQGNENGEPHRDFRCGHGDDEKDEHLGVVVWKAAWTDSESGKSNERQVCRIQHQL